MGEGVGPVAASASVSLFCPRTDVIRDKSNKLEIRRENIPAIVLYCRKIQRIGWDNPEAKLVVWCFKGSLFVQEAKD